MIFLILLEENMFGNHIVAKEKGRCTDVVPAKWTQMIKSVMTQSKLRVNVIGCRE